MADHLSVVEREAGVKLLKKPPKLHESLGYLWDIFRDMDATRDFDLNGNPKRLPYAELIAYTQLTGFPLDIWEVSAIRSMDAAVVEAHRGG